MKYQFKCPQCQETNDVELTIEEYTEYDPVCKRCKVRMDRVYEMPQLSGKNGGAGDEFDPPSACGGSCGSCTSCGS